MIVILHCCTCAAAGSFVLTPSNQEPVEGSQLSVMCSSDEALFIVWYKEGNRISTSSPHFTLTSSSSGSSSTLSIESVNHTTHTGHYSCVAIFLDGTKASVAFNITVKCETVHLCNYKTSLKFL